MRRSLVPRLCITGFVSVPVLLFAVSAIGWGEQTTAKLPDGRDIVLSNDFPPGIAKDFNVKDIAQYLASLFTTPVPNVSKSNGNPVMSPIRVWLSFQKNASSPLLSSSQQI